MRRKKTLKNFYLFLVFFLTVNSSLAGGNLGLYIDKSRLYREYGREKIEELQRLQQPGMNVFKQNYNLNVPDQERNNTKIMKNWYMQMLTPESQKALKKLELYKTKRAGKILQPEKKELKKILQNSLPE